MPKVVIQTNVKAIMNAAAEAKMGRERAASHSNRGKRAAMGTTIPQWPCGRRTTNPLSQASATSATIPSTSSLRGGGSRVVEASSIISGATVRIPSPSDANQCCQVAKTGAVELWKYKNPAVPPSPEIAVATIAEPTNPSTWLNLSRLKPKPK